MPRTPAAGVDRAPAVGVGAGVGRVGQHLAERVPVRAAPGELALARPAAQPVRQPDVVGGQVDQHAVDRAPLLEQVEDQPDGRPHLLVGVERDLARRQPHVAARQVEEQLAAPGLGPASRVHAALEDVQLGLAHGALEAEQQAVVVGRRIVDAVAVGDERVEQGADLEQLVPVAAGAGEPRHLDPEHQADAAEPDLGHQPLEARPDLGRGAGAAEVVVDDHDPLAGPAELPGAFGQGVLEPGRLGMAADLLQGRLPDVDDGEPVTVAAADLLREGWGCHRHAPRPAAQPAAPRGRDRAGARPSGRSGPPACGVGRSAAGARSGGAVSGEAWRRRCSHRASASRAAWPARGRSLNGECASDVPTRVDGKSGEGPQGPPRLGPHLVHQGDREPVPPGAAHGGLLAAAHPARLWRRSARSGATPSSTRSVWP